MRQILILAAIAAATVTAACGTTVICRGDACGEDGTNPGNTTDTDATTNTGDTTNTNTTTNPGGSGPNLSDFCDKRCACEYCGDGDLAECYDDLTEIQSLAIAAGCELQLGALDTCLDGLVCNGGAIQMEICGDHLDSVWLCTNWEPPPDYNDVCAYAAWTCGDDNPVPIECEGVAKCAALCLIQVSCDTNDPYYAACIDVCS